MNLDKDFFKKIWDSVWEENLSEIEVQRKYFAKLDKKFKGKDRFHLIAVGRKIDELEINLPFSNLFAKREEYQNKSDLPIEIKDARTEGDGTEWIIEKDKEGKIFKRVIGSNENIYLKDK